MKFFKKTALVLALTAALTTGCFAAEAFHGAYLQGFPDGTIRPEAAVTRAELAQILYRMMDETARKGASDTECGFLDLGPAHWAYPAVSALAKLRLMLGGPDGRFRPDDGITGQELSIVLERVRTSREGREALPELAAGWSAQNVSFADGNGWVMGLHDGVFSKEQALTRAELAQILNRILGRVPEELSDLLIGMPLFSDNLDTKAPYFLAIQEAAIDHTARADADHETWTGLG